jgi:outer membrane protein TolC
MTRSVLILANRLHRFVASVAIAVALECSGIAQAQYGVGAGESTSQVAGSVPNGQVTNGVLQLSLHDAITQALRYNLGSVESGQDGRSARGERLIALSSLLPQIDAGISEHVNQVSTATLGLPRNPIIPSVLGPFAYSSADVSLTQSLFSLPAIRRYQAARDAEQAAQLSYQDVLDVVTLTVGNAYLQVIEANSRIEAQEAQVRNAKALYGQALSEYQAGTRPRIDVTRTEVQLHTEEYTLSIDRNSFATAKLALARAIGLPLEQEFTLTDRLPYAELQPPTIDEALQQAYESRSDLRASLEEQQSAERAFSAAKDERLPSVTAQDDFSDVGRTFGHSHGNFAFQAGIRMPVFTGGRIKGEIEQARAAAEQRKAEAENLRGQVDYDVRTAFLNLAAATEQVNVARRNVDLANENLARSKDRFASGVTDSVEVVQAEQSLASANDQYITSTYSHNLSKLELARALGVARNSYSQYLGGEQ